MTVGAVEHREKLEAAIRIANAGRMREAEELFRHLLRDRPDDPDAICGLAGLAISRGEGQTALDLLARARERHPRHDGLLGALGSAYHTLGRLDEAMICCDTAIQLAPDNAAHRLTRLQLLLAAKRLMEALAEADRALELAGENADCLNSRGTVLIALGRGEEAAEMFRRAHRADPARADAAHNLSLTLAALGRHDAALPFAERAYLNEPADPAYRVGFARRLLAVGQIEAARQAAEAAVVIAPADVAAKETLASCLVLMSEEERGLAIVAGLVRQQQSSAQAGVALARVLRLAGRFEQALQAVSHARSLAPEDLSAISLERDIERALGRFTSAQSEAERSRPTVLSTRGVDPSDLIFCARWLAPGMRLHCSRGQADLFAGRAELVVDTDSSESTPIVALLDHITDGPPERSNWKPFLEASEEKRSVWQRALQSRPRPFIGLLWDRILPGIGIDAMRSAACGLGTLISLATGPLRPQLEGHPDVLDAGVHIATLSDLAAAIAALDVVVTPGGVEAHLAGALGKPGVVLVPPGYPWQWRSQDHCSVWYPMLGVVKPTRAGQWDQAIAETRLRLEHCLTQISLTSQS